MIGELILGALSVAPEHAQADASHPAYAPGTELDLLTREFPELASLVRGKDVLEYGSGAGYQALALVTQLGARSVLGIEPHPEGRAAAQRLAERAGVADRLSFHPSLGTDLDGRFDVVLSQNAMEHLRDPASAVRQMRACLRPSGIALITFGPPWLAPYGAHMHFFTRVPWVNLLFSERTVMRVRRRYRHDGIMRYDDLAQGLNRMTVRRFEGLIAASGFRVQRRRYLVVKNIRPLASIPGLRELFINHITVVLTPVP